MNSLNNPNEIILCPNVKEETFEDVDFIKKEIDPLDIGFQNDVTVKSEKNEDFVEAKDELLLVEDGLVLDCFGGRADVGSKMHLNDDVIHEETESVHGDFMKGEMDPSNVVSQNEDCGVHIEAKVELEELIDIDFGREETSPFDDEILDEDKCQSSDKCEDDPQSSTYSGEAMDVLGKKVLRAQAKKHLKSEINQAAVERSFQYDARCTSFNTVKSFTRHLSNHSLKKKFKCDVCEKDFTMKGDLVRHMMLHSEQNPFTCEICHRKFSRKDHLESHILLHTGEKPFECDVCGKRSALKKYLKAHMRIHSEEKPFACDVCKKRFNRSHDLKVHMRIHSGEEPFVCDVCKRRFNRKHDLKLHMRIHSEEKPFACDVCEKRFSLNHHLKDHKRLHTGEKPFVCVVCQKAFIRKSCLNNHLKNNHENF